MKDNESANQAQSIRCKTPRHNPIDTTAVIQVNWHRLTTRGPSKTLAVLQRMFPQFRLYRCSGPGFTKEGYIATARGTIGRVIIEPYVPESVMTSNLAKHTTDSLIVRPANNRQEAVEIACGLSMTV